MTATTTTNMDELEIPDEDKEAIYAPQLLIEYEKKPSFS
jgi:hypothetical protein